MGFNMCNSEIRKVKCISNNKDAVFSCDNELLEVGKVYTVSSVTICKWHTEVTLQELEGKFNALSFDEIE